MDRFLAHGIVLLHLAYIAFVIFGAALVARNGRVALLHVPAVLWAVFAECGGRICPLTPLENAFRARAGLDRYEGDFVAEWVFPWLYPEHLDRTVQIALGAAAAAINIILYACIVRRALRRQSSPGVE